MATLKKFSKTNEDLIKVKRHEYPNIKDTYSYETLINLSHLIGRGLFEVDICLHRVCVIQMLKIQRSTHTENHFENRTVGDTFSYELLAGHRTTYSPYH